MWIILVLLLTGSIAGYLLTRVKSLNALSEKISMYTIYVLLFFMGLNVGTKPEIMKNLAGIGFDALLIALFAIAGSVATAYLLFSFILRKHEE